MNSTFRFLFLFSMWLLPQIAGAIEPPPQKPAIQWIVNDFPPFLVLSGEGMMVDISQAKGPFASIYQEIERALPGYSHRFVRVSFTRAEKLFSGQGGYCTVLLQKTKEREKFLIFGDELARAFPVGLVVHTKGTPGIRDDQKDVDLKELLATGKFRLGVIQSRAYTQQIDDILSHSGHATKIVGDSAMGNLFLMLEKKRVNGVLAYALEKTDYERNNIAVPALKFLNVKNMPNHISVWASCEKSLRGEQILKDLTRAVREKNVKGKIYKYFMQELPPDMKKSYRDLYDTPP